MTIKLPRRKSFTYYVYGTRLNSALKQRFFLEAVFIEYAIIEDRAKSILMHEGKWGEIELKRRKSSFITLKEKLDCICELVKEKDKYASSFFRPEFLQLIRDIRVWIDKRNDLVHELMDRMVNLSKLEEMAIEGKRLSDRLSYRASSYKQHLKNKGYLP